PRPARRVRADGVERFGRRAQLAGDLPHEVPEHVLLAGEVLIEGHARAASERRDPLDAAPVIALVAERPERGVEDSLLRALPPRPDLRVVGKRGPPSERQRPAGPPVTIVIGHRPMLARNDMAVRLGVPREGRPDVSSVAVITGAASGMGRECVETLRRAGDIL